MSKLNDIVDIGGAKSKEKIIAEIKDFMLEVIGEDVPYLSREQVGPNYMLEPANEMIEIENAWKAELRQKVNEL